jgi:hypothetical protein
MKRPSTAENDNENGELERGDIGSIDDGVVGVSQIDPATRSPTFASGMKG